MRKLIFTIIYSFSIFFFMLPWGKNGACIFGQTIEKYVSIDTGDDGNDGSQVLPWATIKNALANVSGSESAPVNIYVAQGTYNEYEISMKPYVSIYGGYSTSTWDRDIKQYITIVDGSGASGVADVFNGKDNSTIDGFTIQNANQDGVDADSYSPTISNCIISNCSSGAVRTDNGGPIVLKNILAFNGYGILAETNIGATPIVENNLIIGSVHDGIYAANMTIMNNTIDKSGSYGIYVGTAVPSPNVLIQNNNVTRNHLDGVNVSNSIVASGITIKYNNVYGNDRDNYGGQASSGEGDISYNPFYVKQLPESGSSTNYDYHLQWNSPSINAGTNDDAPSDDLDGNPRPANGKTDIGCYEYQAVPPPPPPPPPPPFDVRLNGTTLSAGDAFSVDVTVPPCNQAFDAWGVVLKGAAVLYSFDLRNPANLVAGAKPLIKGVRSLPSVYEGTLCSIPSIPGGAEGQYSVIVGLVLSGVTPKSTNNLMSGYWDMESLTINP
ncbi:MAG: right-handed parallel beta-helix repeat-containing protein [Candidatus Aureabacteria bacterium]|nr:right-handed parallel beta-helix repeat-containing protein [Candidatus Auribacterota bacterium]